MVYAQANIYSNKTHKILWDFETEMDCPISARRPELLVTNSK